MKWRKTKSFFSFTRSEREGIISLLVLILIAVGAKQLIVAHLHDVSMPSELDVYEYIHHIESQSIASAQPNSIESAVREDKRESFFPFDPNSLDDAGWVELGLSKKQVASLRKYQSYGVKFREKQDLKKVYVLDSTWLVRHWDDIEISVQNDVHPTRRSINLEEAKETANPSKVKQKVEINSADTFDLQGVSGIGAYTATKIVNFRNALGGFHSKEQLKDVYGLHPDSYQKIIDQVFVNNELIAKMDVNTLVADSLRKHPYVSWKIANAIVKYREQHGTFSDINELKRLHLISDSLFLKLKPYLSIGYDH